MSNIEVRLSEEHLDALCEGGPENGPKLAALIQEDLAEFDQWIASALAKSDGMGGRLSKVERSIVQTYVYWKLTRGRHLRTLQVVKIDEPALEAKH